MNAPKEQSPGLRDTITVMRAGLRGIYRSRLPQMSAALAFRTLFALIPMLVISIAAIGAFAEPDDVRTILNRAFDSAGISSIMVQDPIEPLTTNESEAATGVPSKISFKPVLKVPEHEPEPDLSVSEEEPVRLEAFITELVDRLMTIPFGAIGAVGVLTLIYAAISMLTEIERAFNQVYRAQVGRSWGRRITQYWTILTLGSILLFATFYVSEQFRGLGAGAAGSVVSVAITALLLLLAYTMIPNTRVHVRTAVVGAIIAAILWEVAKWGFRQYVGYSVSYAKIYGSLAILPLFMLWIYFTWLIVLFGMQVSYGLQYIASARKIIGEDDTPSLIDPASVIALLALIATRFNAGKTAHADRLADELGLPAATIDAMLDRLTRDGFLRAVDGGDDRYVLARPPEKINLTDAVDSIQSIADTIELDGRPWARPLQAIRDARHDALKGLSLAKVLGLDTPSGESA
ncbi:MAG TPA: YihY family inner membrane protein [Phycisphaerales bacterium]|nr:YihY family inner membrane protein [Phycisphaerales bacterium]